MCDVHLISLFKNDNMVLFLVISNGNYASILVPNKYAAFTFNKEELSGTYFANVINNLI